jgi:hypothetical protein
MKLNDCTAYVCSTNVLVQAVFIEIQEAREEVGMKLSRSVWS